MENEKKKINAEMLDRMYKNVKMGSDSMISLMSKVKNDSLKKEMTAQLKQYEDYGKTVGKMIYDQGGTPKEENIVTKMSSKIGMAMNTMTDTTTSHLAEMIIQGTTMGMTDMTKLVREYENKNCGEAQLKLAREIATFEDNSIETIKKFL